MGAGTDEFPGEEMLAYVPIRKFSSLTRGAPEITTRFQGVPGPPPSQQRVGVFVDRREGIAETEGDRVERENGHWLLTRIYVDATPAIPHVALKSGGVTIPQRDQNDALIAGMMVENQRRMHQRWGVPNLKARERDKLGSVANHIRRRKDAVLPNIDNHRSSRVGLSLPRQGGKSIAHTPCAKMDQGAFPHPGSRPHRKDDDGDPKGEHSFHDSHSDILSSHPRNAAYV